MWTRRQWRNRKKLDAAMRLCEKVIEHGLELPSRGHRLCSAIEKLTKTQEDAEALQSECRFAIKYKKFMVTKKAITEAAMQQMDDSLKTMISELQANAVLLKHEMKGDPK